jgi:hypothetical protein
VPKGVAEPAEARFWRFVDKGDGTGCWLWTGGFKNDYGEFKWNGKIVAAHRVAWILTFGQIPNGLHVLHHCDNPPCVRPDPEHHLFLGTHQDNMADASSKGRMPGKQVTFDVEWARQLRASGLSYRAIGRQIGVSGSNILRALRK